MSSRHTILVVDDEVDLVHSVKELLKYDYRVLGATRAVEGLKIVDQEPVQLPLTRAERFR